MLPNLITPKDVVDISFIYNGFGELVVDRILISGFKWVPMFVKYCTEFDSIMCYSGEISTCELIVLFYHRLAVSEVLFLKFML